MWDTLYVNFAHIGEVPCRQVAKLLFEWDQKKTLYIFIPGRYYKGGFDGSVVVVHYIDLLFLMAFSWLCVQVLALKFNFCTLSSNN
jgi:hypothetical protein